MKRGNNTRLLSGVLVMALVLSGVCSEEVSAKKKVVLNKKKVTLYVGEKVKLKVKGTKKKVVWKSSRKKIATVSKKGLVKARKKGNATITAKTGSRKLTCRIIVKKQKQQLPASTNLPTEVPVQTVTPTNLPSQTAMPPQTAMPSQQPPASEEPVETPFVTMAPYETGTPEVPVLSVDAGIYEETFTLQMAAQPGTEIYYTTDGSIPTTASTKYENGFIVANCDAMPNVLTAAENIKKMYISGSGYDYVPKVSEVAKCTVIRAIAIAPDGQTSDVVTKSYFVGNDVKNKYAGATVASIVMDPYDLLDDETGIHVLGNYYEKWKKTKEAQEFIAKKEYYNYEGNYTQSGKDWERVASMEYFDADNETLEFSVPVGVRVHGGASRMYGQKSFNIYLREEYGQKNLKYELLPNDVDADGKQIKKYKSFMLRNGGNDTEYTKVRDLFVQNQVADRKFAIQATRPCVLFLNGEYWGLYNLTEKYGDNNLEETFGVDKDNVVVFKENELDEGQDGDEALYEELWAFVDKDFTSDTVYEEFCNIMDIDSFADYYATEIYIANKDWNPEKNYLLWRTRTPEENNPYGDCKWRYMLYDTEFSMGLYGSTNAATNSFQSALKDDALFAAVMENETFRQKFVETMKDIGSNNFNPQECNTRLDEYTALYKPLMQDFYARFYGDNSWYPNQFDANIKTMKTFVKDRYNKIVGYIEEWMEQR